MRVLVTGGAGFIGSHLVEALRDRGDDVRILDNFDRTYDPALKRSRVAGFEVVDGDVRDRSSLDAAVRGTDAVIHLAALAGVRASFADPAAYTDVNERGTACVIAAMRAAGVGRLVLASSSSVYGVRTGAAFTEADPLGSPASPYAASKQGAEGVAAASGLDVAVVRLFTVYGPRQRPGMAFPRFIDAMRAGNPVDLYGDGRSVRDYTFVSDAVDGLLRALDRAHGVRIVNISGGRAVPLLEVIATLGDVLGVTPMVTYHPDQPGDVPETRADLTVARDWLGYVPRVGLAEGLKRMVLRVH